MRRRNIALALEAGLLTSTRNCGRVEGYGDEGSATRVAERIRRLGGDLRYVAMDEPLWFGHHFSGATACHTPIPELARQVAANVAAFKRVFPNLLVGDIEPFGGSEPSDWLDEIAQWTHAYKEAVGERLAFFHLDMNWSGAWREQIARIVPDLHAAGIRFGIIYNGNPDDQTDLEWTRHAEQRFVAVEADRTLIPQDAVLQTWMPRPTHMLPETQPGTMTSLVNRYGTEQTRLVLRRTGSQLRGAVTDRGDRPLAGVPVTVSAEFVSDQGAPIPHTRSGQVPPNATKALFALRINAECTCSGPADIATGVLRYRDDRTGQAVQQAFRPPSGSAASPAVFQAQPGQPITQNIPGFAVTAEDPFTVQVPMRTDLASAGSGYVALIFLNAQNKEIERLPLPFQPAELPIGTVATDERGRFSLLLDADTLRTSVGFSAEFPGDARHRTAAATLP